MNTGRWKTQDSLPALNIPRSSHGSCTVKNTVYVIGGLSEGFELEKTIEMLEIKLNADLSFSFISKTWSLAQPDHLMPCYRAFVSAIGDDFLLVYGGFSQQSHNFCGVVIE